MTLTMTLTTTNPVHSPPLNRKTLTTKSGKLSALLAKTVLWITRYLECGFYNLVVSCYYMVKTLKLDMGFVLHR